MHGAGRRGKLTLERVRSLRDGPLHVPTFVGPDVDTAEVHNYADVWKASEGVDLRREVASWSRTALRFGARRVAFAGADIRVADIAPLIEAGVWVTYLVVTP